ncbi:MAG: hypothetical protein ABI204_04315 [Ginsengibacter sp.]
MILIFKTSVKSKTQVKKLKPYFDKILQKAKWNFDLEDCDKILRIDSDEETVLPIINLLKSHQYDCEELA